jgi:hypothetical protein
MSHRKEKTAKRLINGNGLPFAVIGLAYLVLHKPATRPETPELELRPGMEP